jgi:hypothetical protein
MTLMFEKAVDEAVAARATERRRKASRRWSGARSNPKARRLRKRNKAAQKVAGPFISS